MMVLVCETLLCNRKFEIASSHNKFISKNLSYKKTVNIASGDRNPLPKKENDFYFYLKYKPCVTFEGILFLKIVDWSMLISQLQVTS